MPSMQFLPGAELAPAVERALTRRGVPAPTLQEKDVVLCWGWLHGDDGERVKDWSDLRVIDLHHINSNPGSTEDRIYRESFSTCGANESGWLGNSIRTCQGRFSRAVYDGDMPKGPAYVDVLVQFAKVKECDWARFMLAALYASTIMDPDADDLINPA